MSDVVSFKFTGDKNLWLDYKHTLEKQGITVQDKLSSLISQEVSLSKGQQTEDMATASAYEDRLRDRLKVLDLSKVIMGGKFDVEIDDIGFILASGHTLSDRVTNAVRGAIYRYWMKRWGEKTGYTEEQMNTKCSGRNLSKFNQAINSVVVSFTIDIPMITLSDLRESDLKNIIQFECLIIGPTPKKLEVETGKYIQYVLIQEPEGTSKHNNPVMIKARLHGNQTNNIASGMRKKMVGIYTVEEPQRGKKDIEDKSLIIDVITVQDLEEKAEVTLSPYEIEATKEQAEQYEDEYMKALIDSFCPKILGRELEKKALWLSMLGGSEREDYRKEIHSMLCGEADSGKSEMIKFANKIHWKSSIIDGSNATGVGILFALDEYDGMKILRQGAFILNSGGALFVDEYDKMGKIEQKKLNQAQEQQVATYNKGGHIGKAVCKTTVIACCNPTNERWNEQDDIIDNLPFDASTISRYDLILRLRHESHENQVRAKLKHIARRKRGDIGHNATAEWMAGLLNYQKRLNPIIPEDVEDILINKFAEFSQLEQPNGALQIETRQMEGIFRLCEAWAKMLFKTTVTQKIVEDVIKFYQECMATLGMTVEKGISQMDLRGHSTNKDTYFQDVFRRLTSDDEEGHVSITELAESLQENPGMFNSDQSVQSYVEKRKSSGWLYEPKLGVLKRQ